MTEPGRSPRVLLAGAQYVFEVARQFERVGILGGLHTLTAFGEPAPFLRRAGALPLLRRLQSRVVSGIPAGRVHGDPLPELLALLPSRLTGNPARIMAWRNSLFQRRIPERAIRAADAVVGFDTSSWILGQRAAEAGKAFLLERSIGHPRAYRDVLSGLAARYPDWVGAHDRKDDEQIALEDEEHGLAALIAVPSRFVARTLIEHGVAPEKIRVNPFGSAGFAAPAARERSNSDGLRFLFAGTLGVRKGVPVLLEAWRRLTPKHAELLVAGSGFVPTAARATAPPSVRWLGRLPQRDLFRLMGHCDAFVFPSFFEGLAQVIVSAAAAGLPILATPSSGAEEVVADGVTGWLIPDGDAGALSERIDHLIRHPDTLAGMRGAALARAQTDAFTWDAYGDRWAGILNEAVAGLPRCPRT